MLELVLKAYGQAMDLKPLGICRYLSIGKPYTVGSLSTTLSINFSSMRTLRTMYEIALLRFKAQALCTTSYEYKCIMLEIVKLKEELKV